LRIAVISPSVDRQHGTERAVAELIERLARQHGDQVDLYAQQVSDLTLDLVLAASSPRCESESARNAGVGITWHRIRNSRGPHLLQFISWLFANRSARARGRRAGQSTEATFSPGINAFDGDVILVHAVFHRVAELQQSRRDIGLRSLHRKVYYSLLCYLENRIYRNPRVTLAAVSRHTAVQLQQYFGRGDVTVIPNGVNTEYFSPNAISPLRQSARQQWNCGPHDFVLLLIGNDWRNKGLPALLEAVPHCGGVPIRLLVVGQDDRSEFAGTAERLGVAGVVRFCAPVADVRMFYAAADLLVAPSLEDSFNLPVLEAMACRLPVIVSRTAGISEWLADGEDSLLLEDPADSSELAAKIKFLFADLNLRQRIAANAMQKAKAFSWDAHANAVRELLVTAAARKSSSQKS
jgi:UDP-glucose:(heptosyl)LPS alpha-1,3-glucosyltransferase